MKVNTNGSSTRDRVGKVKLTIIMALVVILPVGALMVAVLRNGDAVVQNQVWQAKAQEINRQVNYVMQGDDIVRNDLAIDNNQGQGLLEEYVEFDNGVVKLSIPQALLGLLDVQVKDYIEAQIAELNIALQQLEQDINNIAATRYNEYQEQPLTRGGFSLEAIWVQFTIDGAFFLVTGAISVAKGLMWLTGKKPVVEIIKGAIKGILWFLVTFVPAMNSFVELMHTKFNGASPDQMLSWSSIGAIVANILDMTDSTKQWDGWIIYR
jgi:hypothetical protein